MLRCFPMLKCGRQVDYIDRRHCSLVAVPDDVLRNARTLEELLLDANQIRDLPKAFFRLTKLQRLTLGDNAIGRLPADVGNFMALVELDISRNDLSELPENIKFCKCLQSADFSSNPIGRLPDGFTQLRNLTHLYLNDTQLTDLPREMGQLVALTVLELRENGLQSLPDSFANLLRLESLDLGANEFSTLPIVITSCQSLLELWLDCNELNALPAEIGRLRALQQLDVSENRLEVLPDELADCSMLTDLAASQNSLEYLPDSISRLNQLGILKLDQNRLVVLTPEIGGCRALNELILTENLLSELPPSIGNLRALHNFNIDRNRLQALPTSIGYCLSLHILSVRDNRIAQLPDEMGMLRELTVLDVSGNRLDCLPLALQNCPLKALWLTENQSQPLIKLQKETHSRSGREVFTCYVLPQEPVAPDVAVSSPVVTAPESLPISESDGRVATSPHQLSPAVRSPVEPQAAGSGTVRFGDESGGLSDADENDHANVNSSLIDANLRRTATPHPRELKQRHAHTRSKLRDVDGHMIHTSASKKDNAPFLPQRDRSVSFDNQSEPIYTSRRAADGQYAAANSLGVYGGRQDRSSSLPNNKINAANQISYANIEIVRALIASRQKAANSSNEADAELKSTPAPSQIRSDAGPQSPIVAGGEQLKTLVNVNANGSSNSNAISKLPAGTVDQGNEAERAEAVGDEPIPEEDAAMAETVEEDDQDLEQDDDGDGDERPKTQRRAASPMLRKKTKKDDEGSSGGEELEYFEKHVGFSEDVCDSDVDYEDGESAETRLRRRDTPHHLKNKRILSTLENDAEQKVKEILAQTITGKVQQKQNAAATTAAASSTPVPATTVKPSESMGSNVIRQPPAVAVEEQRLIEINRQPGVGLGISIAGGLGSTPFKLGETGVFVSRVSPDAPAARAGLQVGDKILSVNGRSLVMVEHQLAVEALRSAGNSIQLLIARESFANYPYDQVPVDFELHSERLELLLKRDENGLGFSIAGGKGSYDRNLIDSRFAFLDSIYVSRIVEGGAAEKSGQLRVGDKVTSINGVDVTDAKHDHALALLMSAVADVRMVVVRERLVRRADPGAASGSAIAPDRDGQVYENAPPTSSSQSQSQAHSQSLSQSHSNGQQDPLVYYANAEMVQQSVAPRYPRETIIIRKTGGPLGLSICGGSDHSCHPFGRDTPGIFVSKILPNGAAARSNLRIGDRLLSVSGVNLENATHQEAVMAIISAQEELVLSVQHDPQPAGLREINIERKSPQEKIGISIKGGIGERSANPTDPTDEGVFITKIHDDGAVARDGRLLVGTRILEVNGHSLLGASHPEAVRILRNAGESVRLLVCDGLDAHLFASANNVTDEPAPTQPPLPSPRESNFNNFKSVDTDSQSQNRKDKYIVN